MVFLFLATGSSGMEIKKDGEDVLVKVIDYGNGVYYIATNTPLESSKTPKEETRSFGVELSELISRNNTMEVEVITPYEEMGYTKGYYVVFTPK